MELLWLPLCEPVGEEEGAAVTDAEPETEIAEEELELPVFPGLLMPNWVDHW